MADVMPAKGIVANFVMGKIFDVAKSWVKTAEVLVVTVSTVFITRIIIVILLVSRIGKVFLVRMVIW